VKFQLSARSRERLRGVHPDLVRVVERALELTPVDFVVVEGLRTIERQRQLVAQGASRTLNSRHLTGHAVDIAPWIDRQVRWDWPAFRPLIAAMREAARELEVPVIHGADWKTFVDGPHHELCRKRYP
jgi:peptidoglycan L-alanyl-D-glutamate endopeptidase CwlK